MFNYRKILALFAVLLFAANVNAAVVDLGIFDASVGRVDAYGFGTIDLPSGSAVDESVLFTITNAGGGASSSVSAVELDLSNFVGISAFTAMLDGGAITTTTLPGGTSALFTGMLGNGLHTLKFGGTVTGSAGGIINGSVAVKPVPLPAAVWLFGSALIGLFGFKRRPVSV